jgi:hypothetical protein
MCTQFLSTDSAGSNSLPTKLLALILVCWAGDLLFLLVGVDQVDELASHALGVHAEQSLDVDGAVV